MVVAAEGFNELGKGVLQVSLDVDAFEARCQKDPVAAERRTFRASVDAVQVVGFRHSDKVTWCFR